MPVRWRGEFTPDTGGETIEVSFGEGDSYIFSSQTQDGAGLMKNDSAWYLVGKEAFSTLSGNILINPGRQR